MDNARLAVSGRTKALSAQIASPCEANSILRRVHPCISREAKAKAPLCANSVTASVSLPLPAPSANDLNCEPKTKTLSAKDLSHEAKDKAPLGINSEAISASLKERALLSKAKLAFKGRAKTIASPCEVTLSGETILASPTAKKAFKAKPKASQPKGANFQSPRVSVLDHLGGSSYHRLERLSEQ